MSLIRIKCLLLVAMVALTGCSDDDGGDCASEPDFTSCAVPGAPSAVGICLAGDCLALVPCGPGGCSEAGPRFPLPDTNLRKCFGPSPSGTDGTIDCPDTPGSSTCAGADHCGQDAQYGWDVENAASERYTVSLAVSAEPVVEDNVTGLVWQGCTRGQSGADCATGDATLFDWYDAVSYCDALDWGGHADWKLPDRYELHSIIDFERTSPAIDQTAFVNTPSRFAEEYDQWWIECQWSSTDYAGDTQVAWVWMVNSGDLSEGSGTTYHLNDKAADGWEGCYVRCVRESSPPVYERFIRLEPVAGEPVVADTITQLLWQGCSAGQSGPDCSQDAEMMDWRSSLAYCEGLSWGGYDDWHLPNIKEIASLIDSSTTYPAIDVAAFPNTPYYGPSTTDNIGQYWSSTARSYNSFALYADFSSGFTHFYEQPEGRHVRCVRSP